ncbi:MAG TPA: leucine--tRNA ligase, partial [Clostridiales bacterium]|nr:leucine--tRNA ligase [Clostridiales bacterium]
MSYNHKEVELKWQKIWAEGNMFRTKEDCTKPKCYVLDMFPYPSGEGLHVGHIKGYTATDTYSRYKELNGFNILHPIGWDAFGLPAENYALKNKMHPEAAVKKNIDTFKSQLSVLGVNYDWEREISTTDPEYYKWTQWIFIKLYNSYYDEEANKAKPIEDLIEKKYGHRDYYKLTKPERKEIDDERLAFEEYEPINWCPSCKTGLANEDLEDGNCERCGSEIEQKPMLQWVLRIKKYADRMLYSLDSLDWESMITDSQRNWIGRSEGAEIDFKIEGENNSIRVYTTRPDT